MSRSRRVLILLCGVPAIAAAQGRPSACGHPPAAPRLDHAIAVVDDLGAARERLAPFGFRFKRGRLHANALLNDHIKFRDGTELELMTLAGPPGDRMARDYATLLAEGPGGAYVALRARSLDAVARAAAGVPLPFRRSQVGSWEYLDFPGPSDAAGLFFISDWGAVADPESLLAHPNGAHALHQVWVEGGERLGALLRALGTIPCDTVALPDGRRGVEWGLSVGSLLVLPPRATASPRVVGVVLATSRRTAAAPRMALPGFWVGFVGSVPAAPR